MVEPSHFRLTVDRLVEAEKTLAGQPSWEVGPYDGCYRWLSPLAINGETTGMNLCVDSFPRSSFLEFHILLIYETCISRLDFSENECHRNARVKRVQTPSTVTLGWIYGPHIHKWADNWMIADIRMGMKELEFAVPIPATVRTFDAAFRYFVDEHKIIVAANETPNLPVRDTIL